MFTKFRSPVHSPKQSFDCGAPTQDASVIGGKSHALDDIQEEAAELLSEAFVRGDGNSISSIGSHLATNTLEAYGLGMLIEAERDIVEDHLLVCNVCTEKLEIADRVIVFMKTILILDKHRC